MSEMDSFLRSYRTSKEQYSAKRKQNQLNIGYEKLQFYKIRGLQKVVGFNNVWNSQFCIHIIQRLMLLILLDLTHEGERDS